MRSQIGRRKIAILATTLVASIGTGSLSEAGLASASVHHASLRSSSSSTPAAGLYASLDQLLREHVDMTATVVETAVANGGNLKNPEVTGAIRALGENTDALGAAFGSLYGKAAQAKFLSLWRAHIGFFVNYTLGLATHDRSKVAVANRDLQGYVSAFSSFVSGATKLPQSAVAADLEGHISTLETAIRAIVAKKPAAGTNLLMAENHMVGTAAVLAQGIATSLPTKFGS